MWQRSPEGALGKKRAGPWEGTELDLDDYRSSKRGRGQVRQRTIARPEGCSQVVALLLYTCSI